MSCNHINPTANRTGLKDVWNAFMCQGAKYSSHDIPFCPTKISELPKNIITWEEARVIHKKMIRKDENYYNNSFVCFYIDDYKFEGPNTGIWNKPWNAYRILKHFRGIITPDFSTYQDFPYPLKIYNTYRMRAFGYWIGNLEIEVINNVRWGTSETFSYCFDGIERNSIVAIGTVGGNPRKVKDRHRFEQGFFTMIDVLKPQIILTYGSSNYDCFEKASEMGIKVIAFPSKTAKAFERSEKNE